MTNETLALLRRKALNSLVPPKKQKLSDWIEGNVILPATVSALPGPIRLLPYQKEMADAIGDPAIERVTLVKPVRVGFTTLLTGAIGSYCTNDPSPVLVLLPTEDDCRRYMVDDIEPIFHESPTLASALSDGETKEGRNTILSRRFAGGSLKFVAAKAPRNLRSHNIKILLIDEVDAMAVTSEGSPVLLAEKRTLSFANRKIIIGSTPLNEETSHVLRSYALSDQRVLKLPCPECGQFHEIEWKDIHWPDGKPEAAYYVCPSCRGVIDERHKPAMVQKAMFFQTRPDIVGHAGFRLNALVSLMKNARWGNLASEFLAAKGDPSTLQTFVNTILAQGWKEDGEELDERELATRAEDFGLEKMPTEVLCITAGVDVQHDRIEVSFLGWSRDGQTYILGHSVVWGLWDDDSTWSELETALSTKWRHPLGGRIGIEATVIDSGDGTTMEKVYSFCFPRSRRKILAGKGVAGTRPWLEASKSKVKGGRLWLVGVDGLKTAIMNRLARGTSIRFSTDLEPVWFEQLASEKVVVRYVRGQPVRRFERISGKRSEALDCVTYGFAAKQVVNVQWDSRIEALKAEGSSVSQTKSTISDFSRQLNR